MKTKRPRRLAVYTAAALEEDLMKASQAQSAKDGFPSWSEWIRTITKLYVDGVIVVKPPTLEVKK